MIEQVANVCHASIVRDAWDRGQDLAARGWIYGLDDGRLRDLRTTIAASAEVGDVYRDSLQSLG